jgi:Ankyrin repeats (3 copies)
MHHQRLVRRVQFVWISLLPFEISRELTLTLLLYSRISSFFVKMARKKAQRKQETTPVPHRTPNLSALLERAKSGSAQAIKAYLDAGGAPMALVEEQRGRLVQLPLLLHVASTSRHPHRELAESVSLLMEAGAIINMAFTNYAGFGFTALICATENRCCTAVLEVLLQAGADPCTHSLPERLTALHAAAAAGMPESCELFLARAATGTLLEKRDADGWTALMHAARGGCLDTTK